MFFLQAVSVWRVILLFHWKKNDNRIISAEWASYNPEIYRWLSCNAKFGYNLANFVNNYELPN